MDIADVIAMLIAIAAIGYSIVSTILAILNPDRYKKQPDTEDEDEEDDDEDELETRARPLPPPAPAPVVHMEAARKELPPQERFSSDKFDFDTKMDHFRQKTTIEDRTLTIGLRAPDELVSDAVRLAPMATESDIQLLITKKEAPIRRLVGTLASKRLLWIAHEVIDKPLVFRGRALPWDR